jgi:hypothetical protein
MTNPKATPKPTLPPGSIFAPDLKRWRASMKWNVRQAAAELGLSTKGYNDLELGRGGRLAMHDGKRTRYIPVFIALACAALRRGIKPIKSSGGAE